MKPWTPPVLRTVVFILGYFAYWWISSWLYMRFIHDVAGIGWSMALMFASPMALLGWLICEWVMERKHTASRAGWKWLGIYSVLAWAIAPFLIEAIRLVIIVFASNW